MTGCPHTTFARGTRIRITLKDGSVLLRRFIERRGRSIAVHTLDTRRRQEIPTALLRVVGVFIGSHGPFGC
ncbi:MAG TPA: hypothetical protein VN660_02035 [Steroidobacteraceae bacterium]|nr:hypothetical protein [Steroidobacteraceae bacterium]